MSKQIPVCSHYGKELMEIIVYRLACKSMWFNRDKGEYEYLHIAKWRHSIKNMQYECPHCHETERRIEDLAIDVEVWKRRQKQREEQRKKFEKLKKRSDTR